MTTAFKLSLPVDIPWERICVSTDMMDRDPCDLRLPPKWQSSLAVHRFVPDEDYQTYPGRKITYLKVTASITGYQPRDAEVQGTLDWGRMTTEVKRGLTQLLDSYHPCHGAILQVAVGPKRGSEEPLERYPYILDVEPKKRELLEVATDTQERSSRSFETLNIGKSGGSTRSQEVLDIDTGSSVSGGVNVKGTGVKFGYSQTGQWGTKSLNNDTDSVTRTSNLGDEQRDSFSHTTQLSQLYHLLDSYHVGTNRAVFLMTPRPHVLEAPSGFVRGPRPVEGMQEFFLVVSQPEDADDFCVSVRLDTSHLVNSEIFDVETRSELTDVASAFAPAPIKNDPSAEEAGRHYRQSGFYPGNTSYQCLRKRVQDTKVYQAPAGFRIAGFTDVIKEEVNGSTGVAVVPGTDTLTLSAEATGHACHEFLGCMACEPVVNQYSGHARRQVRVSLVSEDRTVKVGEEDSLLITTRGLCCCPDDGTTVDTPRVGAVHRLPRVGTAELAPINTARTEAEDDAPPPAQRSPGMTIREANEAVGFIRRTMIETVESAAPVEPLPYYQTDLFAQAMLATAVASPKQRAFLDQPALEMAGDAPELVHNLAELIRTDPASLKVRDVVNVDNESLARIGGLGLDQVVRAKMAMLGLPLAG